MRRKSKIINVIGKKIIQARLDHYLDPSELCSLVGLTEEQLDSLENERNYDSFVDFDHRVDCAKRLSIFFGFEEDKFLSFDDGKLNSENSNKDVVYSKNSIPHYEISSSIFFKKLLSVKYFSPFKEKLIEKIINSYVKKISFFELAVFSPSLLAPFIVLFFLFILLCLKIFT